MIDVSTLNKRLGDILMLSLRPAQLMLATSAAIMAVVFFIEGGDVLQPYSHYLHINAYFASLLFGLYACTSVYCSMTVKKHEHVKMIRYGSALTGLVLWSVAFVLEVTLFRAPSTALHIMPICAEAWAIAQLMSNIHEQDRRAL